mmetsp:Transcript_15351/g.30307  ORF Transcript_15351/g.30307 Transcript_15351/m.30307 type:complete len:183 (+) Transcript_15351:126-674(+)
MGKEGGRVSEEGPQMKTGSACYSDAPRAPRLSDSGIEGNGRWSAMLEIGKDGDMVLGSSMHSASDTSSVFGQSGEDEGRTCSVCNEDISNCPAVFYALGRRFCSEGCRCLAMTQGLSDEGCCGGGRPLELQDACPCFPGDVSCPHMAQADRKLERNGAWGFNKFVCQSKGVRLLDSVYDQSC